MGRQRWSEREFRMEAHDYCSRHWRKRQSITVHEMEKLAHWMRASHRSFLRKTRFAVPLLSPSTENGGTGKGTPNYSPTCLGAWSGDFVCDISLSSQCRSRT